MSAIGDIVGFFFGAGPDL